MKILSIALAAAFFVIAALYATGSLQIGTHEAGPHIKHAILFSLFSAFSRSLWLRFQSNSATSPAALVARLGRAVHDSAPPNSEDSESRAHARPTHILEDGRIAMVDVAAKPVTDRFARAEALVRS